MKSGLVIFGAILLALAGILYFATTQPSSVSGAVVGSNGASSQYVTSTVSLPWQIPAVLGVLGIVLMISGLLAPDKYIRTANTNRLRDPDRVEIYEKRERHVR